MIIIGYQGIGKSSLSNPHLGYIDLESSNFKVDGIKIEGWQKIYCNIAKHLSNQGFKVFVSSHIEVREELRDCNEEVVIIYPNLKLKDEWTDKLRKRYIETHSIKDYNALLDAELFYENKIKSLMKEDSFDHIVIDNMNYSLRGLLLNRKVEK